MRVQLTLVVLALSSGCSCGSAIDGLSFACDDDADCLDGSRCVSGVCGRGGVDGGSSDAGALCPPGTFSAAGDPRSCTPWTTCPPGSAVRSPGTETTDRQCRPCAEGTFTATANAAACSVWRTCDVGATEVVPGRTTRDAVCARTADFDPGVVESPTAAAFAPSGEVYASSNRALAGGQDAVLRRLDPAGRVVWARSLADSSADVVAVDSAGQVLLAGATSPDGGAFEGALSRYDAAGTLLRSTPLPALQLADVVPIGSQDVIVAGPGSAVQRLDDAGQPRWLRRLRTIGNTDPLAFAVAVDAAGGVVVVGSTHDTLLGQRSAGNIDGWVWRLDASGTELWARQFGSSGSDTPAAVAVDAAGNIYVAGTTTGALPLQTSASPQDAFVRKYDADGEVLWTRQFALRDMQSVAAVVASASGEVLIAGTTRGLPVGQPTALPAWNALVRKYDADGAVLWTAQLNFGGNSAIQAAALAARLDEAGTATVVGTVFGRLQDGRGTTFITSLTP